MNWINYRRLVNYLTDLDPAKFDYVQQDNSNCGCVSAHIRFHLAPGEVATKAVSAIADFLGLGMDLNGEGCYIFGSSADACPTVDRTAKRAWADPSTQLGAGGIAEALRRLAVVAARHGGEPADNPLPAFQPDDAAFLASVRALIVAPLELAYMDGPDGE